MYTLELVIVTNQNPLPLFFVDGAKLKF